MISARRRWLAGALVVGLGWLASPQAVPVYDGIGQPDEPYRWVAPPEGATRTTAPTGTTATTPVKGGVNSNGLSLQTAEQGPQFSLFLPQFSLAAPGSVITITVTPLAPVDGPAGVSADGNVYKVAFEDPAGPVTLTAKAAVATLYLRATSQEQPQPDMWFRPEGGSWQAVDTTAGGLDVRVARFLGPGEYVVARRPSSGDGGGAPVLPLVLVGALVLLVGVVVVVRLRAQPE